MDVKKKSRLVSQSIIFFSKKKETLIIAIKQQMTLPYNDFFYISTGKTNRPYLKKSVLSKEI